MTPRAVQSAEVVSQRTGGTMTTNDITPDSNPVQLELFSDAVQIPLTKGYIALVDPCDADLAQHKWTALESEYGTVYAYRQTGTKAHRINERLHRIVYERVIGRKLRTDELVDHVNQIGTDCRRSNLRLATRAQNAFNSRLHRNNKSGYAGVHRQKGVKKWSAFITVNRRKIHIGNFDTPEQAAEARREYELLHYGEYAPTVRD
jgi:hypothetical protein